jgi:glycosyltransferase involved in cell wall biosynthesis
LSRHGSTLRIFVPSAATLLTDHRGHGEGLIAWELFSGLAERGHELVVCARRVDARSIPPFEVVETGRGSRWESVEPLAYSLKVARLFHRLGGGRRFDLVHWLFPQGEDEVLFSPASAAFIIGPHSPTWTVGPRKSEMGDFVRRTARPLFRARYERALAAASVILASVPEATGAVPLRFRAKTQLLPFGVDETAFRPSSLPTTPTILFVGSLAAEKGIRDLVDAFVRVRARGRRARLIVAGDGPERAWVEGRRQHPGLNGSLELVGPIPHSNVPELLKRASILCLPSRGEPFGMVVLEAMASGRPVVAVDGPGPRYLVDDGRGGYLVPPADVPALAEALLRVLDNPARLDAMGRHNRRKIEAELSWRRVLDCLEEVYAQAVGRGRG